MEKKTHILVSDFCRHHHLEISFVQRLEERGAVEIHHQQEGDALPTEAMDALERMVRLHQELDIHPEDLDIISDLLDKINDLETEMNLMKAQLRFFERQEGL